MNYLTPRELAERLKVDPGKVTAWIRSGQLLATDISLNPGIGKARYRISETEADRFLRSRTQHPRAPKNRRTRIKRVYT